MSAWRKGFSLTAGLLLSGGCGGEIEARRYNQDLDCLGAIEDVGCVGSSECDDVVTVAESEYGSLWVFPDSCIPDDFEVVEGRFAEDTAQAPLCSSL